MVGIVRVGDHFYVNWKDKVLLLDDDDDDDDDVNDDGDDDDDDDDALIMTIFRMITFFSEGLTFLGKAK